ncbi:MAG: 23S rRNA (adenine(2503)-C(2))-methyltransferase RlmN [Clostridia bacterium]|nr:23S rRNA (adenine(2503)-C(2))-methyltransferase RlmN [Clostridia bacterium]
MSKKDIKSMTYGELCDIMKQSGVPAFRAKQLFSWLYKVESFDEMTNLPKDMRAYLNENFYIPRITAEQKLVSKLDGTTKYLFSFEDGEMIETIVMKYKHGNSVCISSQVGCRMGCSFCASTMGGLVRNLTAGEMLAQYEYVNRDTEGGVSNIVIMGIGEPLDNFDNLVRFLKNINDENGLNMSHRHISVSTSGICERIRELADMKLQITLSVSLHAPNDEKRSRLMPVNRKYGYDELLAACDYYTSKTNKRISYEYTLIAGVNDSISDALTLASVMKDRLAHVNLIPVNEVKGKEQKASNAKRVKDFAEVLTSKGINATVRRTLGSDINASCGQLRRNHKEKVGEENVLR